MRVRILGCSGGIGAGLRTTSRLIDDDVLIDCGTGVGDLSREELKRIRHVFLTHSHLDHTVGLPLFIDTVFDHCIANPVRIHARAETIASLQRHVFNGEMWPDFGVLPTPEDAVLTFHKIRSGDTVHLGERRLHAVDVRHTVPALGYCVESPRGVLAFSGDTAQNESLWPVLNGYARLDELIIEVSFPNEQGILAQRSGHYCPTTMAGDLQRLRHNPRIWVTAMKPGDEERIFSQVCEALPDRDVRRLYSGQPLQVGERTRETGPPQACIAVGR